MESKIKDICQYYLDHVDSLAETLPLAMTLNQMIHKSAIERFEEFEKEHVIYEEEGDNELMLVEQENVHKFKRIDKRVKNTSIALKIVPRSFIVSLVSQFDTFISQLVSELYKAKPELVSSSEKELSFKELSAFKDLEEAKDFIIKKEIESLLRKSHSEQIAWLANKFGVRIKPNDSLWSDFIEVTERRNLFVHTDGKISNQYLSVCSENGVSIPKDYEEGTELEVSQEYYENACETFAEMGFKLSQVLWRKIIPSELEIADTQLIRYSFDLLQEQKYELAFKICCFGTDTLPNVQSEETKRYIQINKCIALKSSGEDEECKQIINSLDWSGYKDEYQLAVAVLNDNYKKSYKLMKSIGADSDIFSSSSYRQWPLFLQIRKEEKFKTTFKDIFGQPFTEFVSNDDKDDKESVQEVEVATES